MIDIFPNKINIMLKTENSVTFHRQDYSPPLFTIDQVALQFELNPIKTVITSVLQIRRLNQGPLILKGEDLELISIKIDGILCHEFELSHQELVIKNLPDICALEIICTNRPKENTTVMGLYVSNDNFFTQCEAEGFRKITYYLDQPDVLSKFTVTLIADKNDYPVLLSNGNLIEQKLLNDTKHMAVWEDPFLKPSYLFAIVAGKLSCIQQSIVSSSGKTKLLEVWVEEKDLPKADFAMESLINAIRWDEVRFGLELDLERFMIVAVGDFNMGAMENKGLNIFNTKYVLADAQTATDTDFANIESVVGHEYFHNWTGNRVTCRDWFQLSLKEGLTVFRDQEFSADLMGSLSGRAVKRIEDVRLLRQVQFPEDAGPMAHPIRPDSYQEINNFYTVTIYEKGAEVVRMQQTLLGISGFRKGMDLYFKRHDGQAVTCDDFVSAMADANHADLDQFRNWYSQAGTPEVIVEENYDATEKSYQLKLTQTCSPSPGQSHKEPFHIPLQTKFLSKENSSAEFLIELKQQTETFIFNDLNTRPILSINRNFSAPINLKFKQSNEDLLFQFANDDDPFNRWEAGQNLAIHTILERPQDSTALISAWQTLLRDNLLDPAFKQLALTLPTEIFLHEKVTVVNPQEIHQARNSVRNLFANALKNDWLITYEQLCSNAVYSPDPKQSGARALKNLALSMLCDGFSSHGDELAYQQYTQANNMTDRFAALSCLIQNNSNQAQECLADFYKRYESDDLVIDKWFSLQATRQPQPNINILENVLSLKSHSAFKIKNPNRVRSLIHSFCLANPAGFHDSAGLGYDFWADQVIELNLINPQVAARLARGLDRWTKFAIPYQTNMKKSLERVLSTPKLSADVMEVIQKSLT